MPVMTVTSFCVGGAGACLTWSLGFLFLSEFYLKEIISSLYLLLRRLLLGDPGPFSVALCVTCAFFTHWQQEVLPLSLPCTFASLGDMDVSISSPAGCERALGLR